MSALPKDPALADSRASCRLLQYGYLGPKMQEMNISPIHVHVENKIAMDWYFSTKSQTQIRSELPELLLER